MTEPTSGGVQFNRSWLRIVAIILFIIAAVFFFAIPDIQARFDLGLVAVGLACWAAS
jgi:hypothetical protein